MCSQLAAEFRLKDPHGARVGVFLKIGEPGEPLKGSLPLFFSRKAPKKGCTNLRTPHVPGGFIGLCSKKEVSGLKSALTGWILGEAFLDARARFISLVSTPFAPLGRSRGSAIQLKG